MPTKLEPADGRSIDPTARPVRSSIRTAPLRVATQPSAPASAIANGWSIGDVEVPRTRRSTVALARSISVTEL
jgi:hypothetical protein